MADAEQVTSGLLPRASAEPRGVRLDGDMVVDLPAAEVVEAAKASGRLVVVLAGTQSIANAFRREAGLPVRQVIYATPASVRGYSDYEIVVLPRWHERGDAERIWEAMLPGLLVRKRAE